MITVTEQLKNVFEANPLYSKEGQGLNAEVIARFFLPFSSAVWLVTEAEQQEDGDWLFFGYCHIQEWEWGYVLLSQIQEVNVRGLTVQLDKWRELMKYGRKCSYRLLAARIKRELPELYHALALQFYNPYAEQCRQTPTHYILVHSAIEYFIRKQ